MAARTHQKPNRTTPTTPHSDEEPLTTASIRGLAQDLGIPEETVRKWWYGIHQQMTLLDAGWRSLARPH
ncbi:MAG: hypothetical protein H7831_02565 [Magnetococcus sp. WYHC-3]